MQCNCANNIEHSVQNIFQNFKPEKRFLIPLLEEVQRNFGYIPDTIIGKIASFFGLPESQIYGVVTFYSFFKTSPSGKNQILVCRGTACHVRGGKRILQAIQRELQISEGETTKDLNFTLETVACIGACALAPNMTLNGEVYGRLNPQKALEIIREKGKD